MNLAGREDCDRHIERELTRHGIEVVRGPKADKEVAATITGKLGPFKLRRAWTYWIVSGPFPLDVATKLYETDPVWRDEVRAAGHCGCPPPKEWATYRNEAGVEILDRKNEDESRRYAEMPEGSTTMREIGLKVLREHVFADDPSAVAHHATVDDFHIDSELGLRLWADAARAFCREHL